MPAGLFRESGYDDAVELSKTENKPLFLLFDGDWAKDRAKLFSHTLANPTLAQLIRERTVALHIDVIDQAEIAKNHHVTDVPLLILISPEGREISRWFGAPKPTSFTEELGALLSGKSALQIKQGKIKPSDLVGRNRIAAALIADGQYEKARAELLWLYNTGIGPDVMVHKKLSTKQVIDNLVFLGGQHPPSVEIIANLREQERLRIVRSPANVMAARKLAALLQVKEDLDATLAIFNTLPAGPAREYVKINIVVRQYARRKDFAKAADLLPLKQALEEAEKSDEMNFAQRSVVRVLMFPFGGTHFSTQIIHHVQERALNRRLFFYEVYAGAGRTDEARQIALAILDWDRLNKAPAALRASTQKVCGEKADAFLQSLAISQLAEPKK